MTLRSQRMQPVADIADDREQDAARHYGDSQRALAEQETRLRELIAYREEYMRNLQERSYQGMRLNSMNDYRRFIAQLDQNIALQEQQVGLYRRASEHRRQQWMETRTHAMAIDKAIGRYRQQEIKQMERRDQAETDEFASRFVKPF